MKRDDLIEIYNALVEAVRFHTFRDEMNATLHQDKVRFSPLTKKLIESKNSLNEELYPPTEEIPFVD